MEDYKKKYEDALKKAKENKPIEEIFPELSENEDEKIRKGLIEYFKYCESNGSKTANTIDISDILAWLEKQKEQIVIKQNIIDSIRANTQPDWDFSTIPNLHKEINRFFGEKFILPHTEDTIITVSDVIRCAYHFYKFGQQEQKPIESNEVFNDFVRWFVDERTKHYTLIPSDEDVQKWGNMILEHARKVLNNEQKPVEMVNDEDYGVDGLYAALDILKTTLGHVQGYQSDDGILEHKAAITTVKNLYEQKHVKWSEEDEKMLSDITDCIIKLPVFFESIEINGENKVSSKFISEVKNWLKSFKYRVQLQPKQEWSEEDENTRNKIIGSLAALRFYVEGNKKFDTERIESNLKELDSEIEWMQNIVPNSNDVAESQEIIIIPKFRHNDIITSSRNYAIKYRIKEVGVKNELGEYDYVVEDISDNPKYKGRIHNISIKRVDEWGVLVERNNVDWSEEDKEAMCVIKDIIRHSEKINKNIYTEDVKNKLFDWLQALHSRPKQECSEESYVSFETAKLLKEKGFPVKEISFWHYEYDGKPTKDIIDKREYPYISQSLAMRWLRVKFCFFIEIRYNGSDGAYPMYDALIQNIKDNAKPIEVYHYNKYSYVEACEAAIKYCLENLV